MELPVTAVYDANILYRAPLRDLFIRIAQDRTPCEHGGLRPSTTNGFAMS